MDAAIAALAGAGIGALGSFGAAWLQQQHQNRRDLTRIAAELAEADYARLLDRIKGKGGRVPPISVYVAYHADVLSAIARDDFGPATVKRIEDRMTALFDALPDRTQSSS